MAPTGWRRGRGVAVRRRAPIVMAAVLLGIATFSKPTHVLLMLPLLGALRAAAAVAARPGRRGRCSPRWWSACSLERRHHRRVELPGRRPQDVLQRMATRGAFRSRPTTARSTRPASAARTNACRSKCWRTATPSSTCSATTSCISSSAGTPGSCRYFFPGRRRGAAVPAGAAPARRVAVAGAGRRRSARRCS